MTTTTRTKVSGSLLARLEIAAGILTVGSQAVFAAEGQPRDMRREIEDVAAEHGQIGNTEISKADHPTHPDAQWFPDAGLGFFLHWGISSVRGIGISWSMIPGRPLSRKRISDPDEIARIIREQDYELKGTKPGITPLEYWEMAKDFHPDNYRPEVWLQKAKDAGFTYAVLTTKHHDGFALWPSKYGEFNTATYGDGRDYVKEYVEACRKVGLKVGLYFSSHDWHMDRKYMNFLYYKVRKVNPEFPELGPDLLLRTETLTGEELRQHQTEYGEKVRGQILELLNNYGKIDLLWFDGVTPVPNGTNLVTQAEIRELQPGIVINPRFHRKGDFKTYEGHGPQTRPLEDKDWAELCTPWSTWEYRAKPQAGKDLNTVLSYLVRARSLGMNMLLGFGPMPSGDIAPYDYENIEELGQWMKTHGEAIYATERLYPPEKASVRAVAKGNIRYLYVHSQEDGATPSPAITLSGVQSKPDAVVLLSDGKPLEFAYGENTVTIRIPENRVSSWVDVIKVCFANKDK